MAFAFYSKRWIVRIKNSDAPQNSCDKENKFQHKLKEMHLLSFLKLCWQYCGYHKQKMKNNCLKNHKLFPSKMKSEKLFYFCAWSKQLLSGPLATCRGTSLWDVESKWVSPGGPQLTILRVSRSLSITRANRSTNSVIKTLDPKEGKGKREQAARPHSHVSSDSQEKVGVAKPREPARNNWFIRVKKLIE